LPLADSRFGRYFELNFGESIASTLTPPWIEWDGESFVHVDGVLDITVDNIFTFSFLTSKLFIKRVGMSDLDGVSKTYPFTHFPLNWGPYPGEEDHKAVSNIADSRTTFVPSGELSDVIKVPIEGDLEALSRAVSELYVEGRFCLHITEAMADLSLQCEDALLAPFGLACESKEVFGLTVPWSIPDVNLYRKHACHNPRIATDGGCVPVTRPLFSFDGGLGNFTAGLFEAREDTEVQADGIVLNTDKDQNGRVWLKEKQMVRDGFEISFEFQLENKEGGWFSDSGDMAGGFALVIQNSEEGPLATGNVDSLNVDLTTEGLQDDLLNALADTNTHISGCGYEGIENSVGVLFSLKQSQFYNIVGLSDWQRASVSVWENGLVESGSGSSTREKGGILGYIQIPDDAGDQPMRQLNNFEKHTARVVYNSVWRQIYVYLDDMDEVFLNAPIDLGKDIGLGDDGKAWVGFTTQIDYAYGMKVDSFGMGQVIKDDEMAKVVEEGQERSAPGKLGVFRVDARDSCGLPRTEGGEALRVQMRLVAGEGGGEGGGRGW
jgi:hypothetical protein